MTNKLNNKYNNDVSNLNNLLKNKYKDYENKITFTSFNFHTKASEKYLGVDFSYGNETRDILIPISYRRTGIEINEHDYKKLVEYTIDVYEKIKPENTSNWNNIETTFWENEKSKARITKSFFDALLNEKWNCTICDLPRNSNPQRRMQDLKEMGYTISSDTNRYCEKCHQNTHHWMLLKLPRVDMKGNGYEIWSPELRKRILKVLNNWDVYENTKNQNCLPDHKFSEIRWDDDTKSINADDMTEEEIRNKFQLITNQRNQQKREVCRKCFQTGKRGKLFGIPFYYHGNEDWDINIPKKGKDAEKGCVGCGWYDIQKWRDELIKKLSSLDNDISSDV